MHFLVHQPKDQKHGIDADVISGDSPVGTERSSIDEQRPKVAGIAMEDAVQHQMEEPAGGDDQRNFCPFLFFGPEGCSEYQENAHEEQAVSELSMKINRRASQQREQPAQRDVQIRSQPGQAADHHQIAGEFLQADDIMPKKIEKKNRADDVSDGEGHKRKDERGRYKCYLIKKRLYKMQFSSIGMRVVDKGVVDKRRKKYAFIIAFLALLLIPFTWSVATDCWNYYSAQSSCIGQGCIWKNNSWGTWCENPRCYTGDNTNLSYCMVTLNNTYNFSCIWEKYGTNLCDPADNAATGGITWSTCASLSDDPQGCYNSGYCLWNLSFRTCEAPPEGFTGGSGSGTGSQNPGCGTITYQDLCINVSGCTWDGVSACSGNTEGMSCSDLNKTVCSDFTLLSTCCAWNGTNCKTSYDGSCWSTVPAMPAGGSFCEDWSAFKSQSLCENISQSPWYLPCKWNNVTNECHFNSEGFLVGGGIGGYGGFDEIGTKTGCEAKGGIWKSEQWVDSVGTIRTDSWCEFKFGFDYGGTGNCDAGCWACETGVSTSKGNTTTQARTHCENSNLGYCQFTTDGNAPNGLGWCMPKNEFIEGGGKSCDERCGACDFLNSPQAQCQNSSTGCVWEADTTTSNGVGYCYGKSEKRCGNDCWSCYTSNDCISGNGGSGACIWDNSLFVCKPAGFTGEVCFDGTDNDGDAALDCMDSDCATDKFCGGSNLNTGYGQDCPSFSTAATCLANSCAWSNSSFEQHFGSGGNSSGHCDFPGGQCWKYDQDSAVCNATIGCGFVSGSAFCDENTTVVDACFPKTTSTACEAVAGCGWTVDAWSGLGYCQHISFAQCIGNTTRQLNQANCEQNVSVRGVTTQICDWTVSAYSPNGGYCGMVCFSKAATAADCQTATSGLCKTGAGFCEPKSYGGTFGAGCASADGNRSRCEKSMNATCTWFTDSQMRNNVSNTTPGFGVTPSGYCTSKGAANFDFFMGNVEPIIISDDGKEATVNDSWDITTLVLRDEFDRMTIGTKISDDFQNSSVCNNTPTFSPGLLGFNILNYTFFWYMDSNGNSTDNCAPRDNSSLTGFEFSFKYKATWSGTPGNLTEGKASYRCINGSWGTTPIPLSSSRQKMCGLIGGGMAGIGKEELFKFKKLFNKSVNLRLYATVGNDTVNDSRVTDSAGPVYYSQGAVDFKFEDCSDSGADADGDGLKASNDPDCFDFLKYGFKPWNQASYAKIKKIMMVILSVTVMMKAVSISWNVVVQVPLQPAVVTKRLPKSSGWKKRRILMLHLFATILMSLPMGPSLFITMIVPAKPSIKQFVTLFSWIVVWVIIV